MILSSYSSNQKEVRRCCCCCCLCHHIPLFRILKHRRRRLIPPTTTSRTASSAQPLRPSCINIFGCFLYRRLRLCLCSPVHSCTVRPPLRLCISSSSLTAFFSKTKMIRTAALAFLFLWDLHRADVIVNAFVSLPQSSTMITTTTTKTKRSTSKISFSSSTLSSLNDPRHYRLQLEAAASSSSGDARPKDPNNNNNNNNKSSSNNHPRHNYYPRRRQGRREPDSRFRSNNNNYHNRYQSEKEKEQRRAWLEQATNSLLDTEVGSLNRGKWHELVSMLHAWSKHTKDGGSGPDNLPTKTPIMMERILKRLLDERRAGNDEAKVDISMYNILLDAWACAALFPTSKRQHHQRQQQYTTHSTINNPRRKLAAQRAREILVLLQETYEVEGDVTLQPNEESFWIVFHVVCKTEGAQIARRVLAWMEYLSKVGKNTSARPKRGQYIMLLDAYANSRDENAGQLAEGFLRHMNMTGTPPDTLCYNIAIKAWTRAKRGRESAEHADQILADMNAPKDIVTYSSVISAWATSGMKSHAVVRAEELLLAIEETPGLETNTVVLNTVMSTWVKSRNPGAVNRTTELLEYMEQASSLSSSKMENDKKGHSIPPHPAIPKPDLISYNTHIHALSLHAAKQPNCAPRAQEVLESLERRYRLNEISFAPNLFTYNLVIDSWSKTRTPDAAFKAVEVLRKLILDPRTPAPDTFSFNQVLTALSKSFKPGAAELADKLLSYMEESYTLKIHKHVKPDVISYASVITAWCRSRDTPNGAERAEELLNRLKERNASGDWYLKPNRVCFNSLIDGWAKSGKGTLAARKAEALLQEMEELSILGDDSISPNIVTYNAVLNSWARSGTRCCGNKAERYLDRMWELYHAGDRLVKPNDKTFNTVINAISKSKNQAKAQKALRILRRMDLLYRAGYKEARPNEVTYTSVLNSCAFPAAYDERTRRKALDTAIFTLQELQASRYGQPNQITYGVFMKACANLLPDEQDDDLKRDVLEKVFQQCCQDGQVGEMVLAHLRNAAPKDLYNELLAAAVPMKSETARVTVNDLPLEWRCNVRDHRGWDRERPFVRKVKSLGRHDKTAAVETRNNHDSTNNEILSS